KRRFFWDFFFEKSLVTIAFAAVLTLGGIFCMLLFFGIQTFEEVGLVDFLFGREWNPAAYEHPRFGIGAMLVSTFLVTSGAMIIAIPLGIGTAAFLSELAPSRVRTFLKPVVEMLAAIPSVVVGFWGIVQVGPGLASLFHLPNGLNAFNGSALLAIMSLPTLISVAEDAIHAVPKHYKEASYALGASRWETLTRVTLPACKSGVLAAVMLGLGRALGETMTVLMATGNATAMPNGFFDPVRTITATVAIEMGEVPFGTTHYYSLFACSLLLFLITLIVYLSAEWLAAGFRKKGQ
ncbi:MAG: phosphate ABC transporter permease subunit PstC, partial [Saprospiraceae bacterium]|nr:phosphate ABC transporter permease subunit PstC [Saprospiraceae bacterium]